MRDEGVFHLQLDGRRQKGSTSSQLVVTVSFIDILGPSFLLFLNFREK